MDQTLLKGAATLMIIMTLMSLPGISLATGPLTLSEALEIAFSNNSNLDLASINFRSAEVEVDSQKADFLPTVSADLTAAEKFENGFEQDDFQTAGAGVTARYNLYSGGADTASLKSAQKEYAAINLEYEQESQSLLLEVATAYVEVLSSEEILDVMKEDLESARTQLEKVEAMYEAGSRPITDLYRQQASAKEAELSLLTAQRDLEVSRLKLISILGLNADPGLKVSDPVFRKAAKTYAFSDFEELIPAAIANRSDIAAQKERIEAAREDVVEARSGSKPTVDLTGSISTGYSSLSSEGMWVQLSEDGPAASVGISLSIPLFDARQTQNAVLQAELRLTEEKAALNRLQLQAVEELGTALEDYQTAAKSLEVSETRLQWAEKALESVEARYEAGAANLVELNDARGEANGSRYDVVKASYDCLTKALTTEFYMGSIESAIQVLLEGGEES